MRVGENGKWMKISAVLHASMMLFFFAQTQREVQIDVETQKKNFVFDITK